MRCPNDFGPVHTDAGYLISLISLFSLQRKLFFQVGASHFLLYFLYPIRLAGLAQHMRLPLLEKKAVFC